MLFYCLLFFVYLHKTSYPCWQSVCEIQNGVFSRLELVMSGMLYTAAGKKWMSGQVPSQDSTKPLASRVVLDQPPRVPAETVEQG